MTDPWPDSFKRVLIVSPFLTCEPLHSLTRSPIRPAVVLSRPESFEALGAKATDHLTERLVLASDAVSSDEAEGESTADETVAESIGGMQTGLHAKLYVFDEETRSRILTGSANATWPAFNRNVEFVVELSGPTDQVGVNATIGDQDDRMGLRSLVEPFDPPNDLPPEPTAEEKSERKLQRACGLLGGLRFTAYCSKQHDDLWQVKLDGQVAVEAMALSNLGDVSVRIGPVTLHEESQVPPEVSNQQLTAVFNLSETSVTPYFVCSLSLGERSTRFLITADLIDPPPDREAKVLRSLLTNRQDFLRLLLLLLGNVDEALAAFQPGDGDGSPQKWLAGFGSDALLEPLVRVFAREPQRLHEVERVLEHLRTDEPTDESVLPDGWEDIWGPIAEALESESHK